MIHQPGCDYRCALPCDDDVPCTFSLFPFCIGCVNCRPYCVSCITVEQLKNQARSQASPRTVVHVAQHSFVH